MSADTELAKLRSDWTAVFEKLIDARSTAKRLARALPPGDSMREGLEAQAFILTSLLDFMDERERAA